jgi:hypothetical protein
LDATDSSDREPDGRRCPYCGRECDRHLLAFFDRYGDGLGLIGGALYGVEETADEVLQRVRVAWLVASGKPPAWVTAVAALRFYFNWLGCLEYEERSADESEEDTARQMAWTAGYGSLALDVLRWLLQEECGWRGETTEWEKDDTPGLSTVYELWWEPDDPNSLADRLRERLRRVVMTAEQAASASTASAVSDVQR